jgi:hypothetical protein
MAEPTLAAFATLTLANRAIVNVRTNMAMLALCLLTKAFAQVYAFLLHHIMFEVRMKRTSFHIVVATLWVAAAWSLAPAGSQPTAPAPLNYEFFKAKVEPVFLKKRPGHARCVVCHTGNNVPFHLVPLSDGSTTWNEEQSRQNFELIQRVAAPGILDSPLVRHPLDEDAGGDRHHGGGQQFANQEDPDWLTLKAFVLGATVK